MSCKCSLLLAAVTNAGLFIVRCHVHVQNKHWVAAKRETTTAIIVSCLTHIYIRNKVNIISLYKLSMCSLVLRLHALAPQLSITPYIKAFIHSAIKSWGVESGNYTCAQGEFMVKVIFKL